MATELPRKKQIPGSGASLLSFLIDNFRMNTRYGRYGAAYNMVGLLLF
jgi:hypothetical protein